MCEEVTCVWCRAAHSRGWGRRCRRVIAPKMYARCRVVFRPNPFVKQKTQFKMLPPYRNAGGGAGGVRTLFNGCLIISIFF